MKSTGISRPIDALGRIVLPIELRRTLGIGSKDLVEIYTEDDSIVLRKHSPSCVFCGESDGKLVTLEEKHVCESCRQKLR